MLKPKLRFKEFNGEWKKIHLSEVADRVTRKNNNLETKLPLTISAIHGLIDQFEYFKKQIASKDMSGYYLLKNGEFAYNKSYSNGYPFGSIKRLNRYDMGALSTLYICFKHKNINSDYLQNYFDTDKWHKGIYMIALEGARNHGLLNIAVEDFFNTEHYIPDSIEQKKIADFLNKVDEIIAEREEEVKDLEQQKKGLMQKIFSQQLRFTDSNNNPYPDWKEKKIGDVFEFYNGKAHEQEIDENGEYIVVNSKFISTEGQVKKYTNKVICPLKKDDIVLVMSDVPNGKAMSKCYLIEEDNKYSLNQRICCLRTKDVARFFIYQISRNKYFLKFDNGVSQTNLRKEDVLKCPIQVPCLEEQQKIANVLSKLDELIEEKKALLSDWQQFKKGLLQQMFV